MHADSAFSSMLYLQPACCHISTSPSRTSVCCKGNGSRAVVPVLANIRLKPGEDDKMCASPQKCNCHISLCYCHEEAVICQCCFRKFPYCRSLHQPLWITRLVQPSPSSSPGWHSCRSRNRLQICPARSLRLPVKPRVSGRTALQSASQACCALTRIARCLRTPTWDSLGTSCCNQTHQRSRSGLASF